MLTPCTYLTATPNCTNDIHVHIYSWCASLFDLSIYCKAGNFQKEFIFVLFFCTEINSVLKFVHVRLCTLYMQQYIHTACKHVYLACTDAALYEYVICTKGRSSALSENISVRNFPAMQYMHVCLLECPHVHVHVWNPC